MCYEIRRAEACVDHHTLNRTNWIQLFFFLEKVFLTLGS